MRRQPVCGGVGMWNRVVLLVAGVALGWSLVHYASAAPERQRTHLARLLVALAVGALFIGWLGAAGPQVGLLAAGVFVLSALVAYAANAKQVNRVPERPPLPRPDTPLEGQQGTALLLVFRGEPRSYDGPSHWAARLLERAAGGERIPHWFVRPWTYARIRRAYQRMGGSNLQTAARDALLGQLNARLPQFAYVGAASPDTAPLLADELLRLTQRGMARIVLVPVGYPGDTADLLHEITRTRVREAGVQVAIGPSLEAGVWPLEASEAALERLLCGEALPAPAPCSEAQLAALVYELKRRALPDSAVGSAK